MVINGATSPEAQAAAVTSEATRHGRPLVFQLEPRDGEIKVSGDCTGDLFVIVVSRPPRSRSCVIGCSNVEVNSILHTRDSSDKLQG